MKLIDRIHEIIYFGTYINRNNNIDGINCTSEECIRILDDYIIDFGVWLSKEQIHYERYWKKEHYEELLEIFKKEKGL